MKTRKGIYLDLKDSDYFYRIGELKFYFSSVTYREKFIKKYENYAREEKRKVELKYRFSLKESIFYFTIYSKIETRGFRVAKCNKEGKDINYYDKIPMLEIYYI